VDGYAGDWGSTLPIAGGGGDEVVIKLRDQDGVPLMSAGVAELRVRCANCDKPDCHMTDEVIADLWHANGGFHHQFARAIERWLEGQT
jgi:hypothetical protein